MYIKSITVTYGDGGGASSTTTTYTLVTDASSLAAGDEVLIVYPSGNYAMGAEPSGYDYYRSGEAVTISNNTITLDDNNTAVSRFTLSGTGDSSAPWYFYSNTNTVGYLYSNGGYLDTYKSSGYDTEYINIAISSGTATLTFPYGSSSYPKIGCASGRFDCYSSSNTTNTSLQLFRNDGGGTPAVAPDAPVISPASCTFSGSQTVTITCATSGATIYYTTDGSTPSATNGTQYSSAFTVTATTTVNAIAVKDGVSSTVATATYTLDSGGSGTSKTYQLATSITPGKKYIILNSTKAYAMGHGYDTSNNDWYMNAVARGSSTFTLSGDVATVYSDDIKVFNVTDSASYYKFEDSDSTGYYLRCYSSSYGDLYISNKIQHDTWTVNIGSTGAATMLNRTCSRYVGYSSSYGFYAPTSSQNVYLYEEVTGTPVTVDAPTFSPAGGTYNEAQTVTITAGTGCTIYYTTDGSTPSASNGTQYSGPITVSATTTVNAIAVDGDDNVSTVATATYTIRTAGTTVYELVTDASSLQPGDEVLIVYRSGSLAMGAQPSGESKYRSGEAVTITNNTITLDDSDNTVSRFTLSSTGYSSAPWYFYSNTNTTGYLYNNTSEYLSTTTSTSTRAYIGVSINASTGMATLTFPVADTYDMINYSSTSSHFDCYSSSNVSNVQLFRSTTSGGAVAVATPTISPASGSFTDSETVTITCSTSGATIYYTTDGSTPSASNGTQYSGSFTVTTTTTVKAIAVKDGVNSEVASATYTKRSADSMVPDRVLTEEQYAEVTYDWTDANGNVHENVPITETATDPRQIYEMLRTIYTDPRVPGPRYSAWDYTNHSSSGSPVQSTIYRSDQVYYGPIDGAWNIPGTNVNQYLPNEEGYTVLLVAVNDTVSTLGGSRSGFSNSAAGRDSLYNYLAANIDSVMLLTDGLRVGDQAAKTSGTLYNISGTLNRFFFLGKGQARKNYWQDVTYDGYSFPAYFAETAPFDRMFEQFSPTSSTISESSSTDDFYETMRGGAIYDVVHDCSSVIDVQHYFAMYGRTGTQTKSLSGLNFYVPDYRLDEWLDSSTRSYYMSYSDYQNYGLSSLSSSYVHYTDDGRRMNNYPFRYGKYYVSSYGDSTWVNFTDRAPLTTDYTETMMHQLLGSDYPASSYSWITLSSPWSNTNYTSTGYGVRAGNGVIYTKNASSYYGQIKYTVPTSFTGSKIRVRITTENSADGAGDIRVRNYTQSGTTTYATFAAGETYTFDLDATRGDVIYIWSTDADYSPSMTKIEVNRLTETASYPDVRELYATYANYNPDHSPQTSIYNIKLTGEANVVSNDSADVVLNWTSSLDNYDVTQSYILYITDAAGNVLDTLYTTVGETTYTYRVPREESSYTIYYKVEGRPEDASDGFRSAESNVAAVLIPGTNENEQLEIEVSYESDYSPETEKNAYRNYLQVKNSSVHPINAQALKAGVHQFDAYRIVEDDEAHRILFAQIAMECDTPTLEDGSGGKIYDTWTGPYSGQSTSEYVYYYPFDINYVASTQDSTGYYPPKDGMLGGGVECWYIPVLDMEDVIYVFMDSLSAARFATYYSSEGYSPSQIRHYSEAESPYYLMSDATMGTQPLSFKPLVVSDQFKVDVSANQQPSRYDYYMEFVPESTSDLDPVSSNKARVPVYKTGSRTTPLYTKSDVDADIDHHLTVAGDTADLSLTVIDPSAVRRVDALRSVNGVWATGIAYPYMSYAYADHADDGTYQDMQHPTGNLTMWNAVGSPRAMLAESMWFDTKDNNLTEATATKYVYAPVIATPRVSVYNEGTFNTYGGNQSHTARGVVTTDNLTWAVTSNFTWDASGSIAGNDYAYYYTGIDLDGKIPAPEEGYEFYKFRIWRVLDSVDVNERPATGNLDRSWRAKADYLFEEVDADDLTTVNTTNRVTSYLMRQAGMEPAEEQYDPHAPADELETRSTFGARYAKSAANPLLVKFIIRFYYKLIEGSSTKRAEDSDKEDLLYYVVEDVIEQSMYDDGNHTAVNEIAVSRDVLGVTYYDVQGHASATPWDGINIVVTRYTDGSTETVKVLK